MIITFDTKTSKIKLLQQQNEKNSFVVDFLNEYQSKDGVSFNFSKAIQQICENKEILKILKKEKNSVVLPNQFVCVDSLTVPYEKKDPRQYLNSKFELFYGAKKDFAYSDDIYLKNKNAVNFLIYSTKSQNIFQIVSNFEKYGVKIKRFSFESSEILEGILIENRQFLKENLLIVIVNKNSFQFIMSAKGKLFAHQTVFFDSNDFAKKYAKYVKSNYKKLSNSTSINDKDIEKTKIISQKMAKNFEILPNYIKNFKDYYAKENLGFAFDQVVVVDNDDLLNGEIVKDNLKIKFDETKTMFLTSKGYFIEKKKGLF